MRPIPRTMTLLLFGWLPSLANRFGVRRGRLLFHFGCCTLRRLATETAGKLASIICVDVRVVLSPRNAHVRKAVVDQQLAFLGVHVDQHSIRGLPGCCDWSLHNHSQGAGARGR